MKPDTDLLELGLIDGIVPDRAKASHRPRQAAEAVRTTLRAGLPSSRA
jgi:acetyl-CoA carboxylase alpha subunit